MWSTPNPMQQATLLLVVVLSAVHCSLGRAMISQHHHQSVPPQSPPVLPHNYTCKVNQTFFGCIVDDQAGPFPAHTACEARCVPPPPQCTTCGKIQCALPTPGTCPIINVCNPQTHCCCQASHGGFFCQDCPAAPTPPPSPNECQLDPTKELCKEDGLCHWNKKKKACECRVQGPGNTCQ
eukprot:gene14528-23596_t